MDHQKLTVNGDIINEPRHISNLEQSLLGYVLNNSGCGMKHSTSHVPDTQELTSNYFPIGSMVAGIVYMLTLGVY